MPFCLNLKSFSSKSQSCIWFGSNEPFLVKNKQKLSISANTSKETKPNKHPVAFWYKSIRHICETETKLKVLKEDKNYIWSITKTTAIQLKNVHKTTETFRRLFSKFVKVKLKEKELEQLSNS